MTASEAHLHPAPILPAPCARGKAEALVERTAEMGRVVETPAERDFGNRQLRVQRADQIGAAAFETTRLERGRKVQILPANKRRR
jgi:hypothetical protein